MKTFLFYWIFLTLHKVFLCNGLSLELREISANGIELTSLEKIWKNSKHKPENFKILQSVLTRHRKSIVTNRTIEQLIENEPYSEIIENYDTSENLFLSIPIGEDLTQISLAHSSVAHPDIKYRIENEDASPIDIPLEYKDCFLAGKDDKSWAVISVCSNLMGLVSHKGKNYHFEDISNIMENDGTEDGNNDQSNPDHPTRVKRDFEMQPTFVIYPLEDMMNQIIDYPERTILSNIEALKGSKRRTKRATKSIYTVELGVFVDQILYEYIAKRFGDSVKDTRTVEVVMTLINAVHLLYSDESLITPGISMQVKTIHVLNKKYPYHANGNIFDYLRNFCDMQTNTNTYTAATHWDHALLLTGKDLWTNSIQENSTVGLAYVGGMCSLRFSCTINEATSFAAAFIIAHEMGHNMGMRHDDGRPGCEEKRYLMSPIMSSGTTKWSKCSKTQLEDFLDTNGECLRKTPLQNIEGEGHTGDLPGTRFDADQQCNYMYGSQWKHFTIDEEPFNDVCHVIWCFFGNQLRTPSAPALEGTKCGPRKVCRKGQCQEYNWMKNPTTSKTITTKNSNNAFVILGNDEVVTGKMSPDIPISRDAGGVIYNFGGTTPASSGRDIDCRDTGYNVGSIFGPNISSFLNSFLKMFGLMTPACDVTNLIQ